MSNPLIRTTRWLSLLLSWLTISPLFYYLANRWRMIGKKARIALLLVSPFMLIAYFIIFLFSLQGYIDYQRKYRFADNQVMERITGIPFPELDIVDYDKGSMSFTGDYNDKLTLQLDDELSESTYLYLDSIAHAGDTGWSKSDDKYIYSLMWGNGLPAPKGEDDEEDMMLSLSIEKGSKIVTLEYGTW